MRKSLTAAIAFLFVLGGSIAAASAGWTVARSSGPVWIGAEGAQKISLGPADDLPGGATITTGASGRVLLTRNKEVMTIGPNAVVTIPADNLFGFTTILQQAGQIEFDVEKRNVRHFAVETPFLAAVVKGTHFVVSVNRTGAKVSVSRGRVGVTDEATGQQSDILPGQSARVSSASSGLVVTGTPAGKVGDLAALEPAKKSNGKADSDGDKGKSASSNGKSSGSSGNSGSGSGNSGSGNSGSGNNGSGNSGHGGGGDSGSGSGNSGSGGSDD